MSGMYSWKNFCDKFRRYGRLNTKEVIGLIFTILVIAFIFSFREWGIGNFDLDLGISNLVLAIILTTITMLARVYAQKISALLIGYKVEYKHWTLGLVVCLVLAFVSNGYLRLFAVGGILFHHLQIHRLGRYRYSPENSTFGWIATSGTAANIFLAIISKALHLISGSEFFYKLMLLNIWIAIFSLIPIPPLDGVRLFFGSKNIYFFTIVTVVATGLLLKTTTYSLGGLILGTLVGAAFLFVFFFVIEKNWQKFK
ncbi:hypothetical protein HOK51_10910 [Candidatus Woesearchaeota archaeon]|jgi:Zn-dependent protease|nr:hypothetical protein [Candidatus Woesearchaeota archaeon]MBT6520331.1 hypothetical protein [Candidatus Woesearchaeota archaeon]MBT7368284.1 hypothetical protein [Candidatus Woesearchaeota archaeon]